MLKIQDYDSLRPSLIFVTEYLLTENDPPSEYVLEGYQQLESKPYQNGTRGGVAFYDLSGVEYETNKIINYTSELEYLIIKAKFDKANIKNFTVDCCSWTRWFEINCFPRFFQSFLLF